MISTIIVLSVFFSFAYANFEEEPNDCLFATDCYEVEDCYDLDNRCVSQYGILESYILGNNDILSTLTEAFYQSDDDPAQFVKITYQYQVLDTNDTDNNTCNNHTIQYFWSTSPIFLLGPGPMFWLSLFAIYPPETKVNIQLPCLQQDSKRKLLSRLTYFVS